MKKKLFAIAIAACILALSIAGSSLAYFTDTEEFTNVFTAGKVDIKLTYATDGAVDDETNPGVIEISKHVYPGETYKIGATIANIGNEPAYVGAIITLTDDELSKFVTTGASDADNFPVTVRTLLKDLVANDTNYTVKYTVSADTKVMTIYVVKTAPLAASTADTRAIIDSIVIPTAWDNDEMAAFAGLKLKVAAYATQTVGFTDAIDAITTAFESEWEDFGTFSDLD